jgi:hypothetical protein
MALAMEFLEDECYRGNIVIIDINVILLVVVIVVAAAAVVVVSSSNSTSSSSIDGNSIFLNK